MNQLLEEINKASSTDGRFVAINAMVDPIWDVDFLQDSMRELWRQKLALSERRDGGSPVRETESLGAIPELQNCVASAGCRSLPSVEAVTVRECLSNCDIFAVLRNSIAEEEEVEEGEICQDYSVDIDMKIDRYLGEFREEFEGIISFENLGSRFGMYGSFLPCYQHPPSLLFHPTIQSVPSTSKFSSQQSNSVELNPEVTTSSVGGPISVRKKTVKRNRGGKGSIDVKAHNGREISVKKTKLSDQDCLVTSRSNGNDLGDGDANAVDRESEKGESSTSKGEDKSRTRGTITRIIPGIKDSPPIDRGTTERDHLRKKYRVKRQSQAEFGMVRMQVCKFPRKQALGYGKEARTCIAI
ncbi:hypothetical protein FXO37_08591 [Capsicum annuum]|nr:hypothetical protein FXO37_08591 [Capsicum annuum]